MVLSGKFPIWEILKALEYFPFAEDFPFRKNNLKAPLVFDLWLREESQSSAKPSLAIKNYGQGDLCVICHFNISPSWQQFS